MRKHWLLTRGDARPSYYVRKVSFIPVAPELKGTFNNMGGMSATPATKIGGQAFRVGGVVFGFGVPGVSLRSTPG